MFLGQCKFRIIIASIVIQIEEGFTIIPEIGLSCLVLSISG